MIDVGDLIEDGWTEEEINDYLLDEGYDAEDLAEAWVDAGYDWQDALYDAITDQAIDLDNAAEYADLLDLSISEVYDLYYYGEIAG